MKCFSNVILTGLTPRIICNWAGPGNTHSYSPLVQAQYIQESATGQFAATESDITYAPVNSCDYSGTSTFKFDTNADGSLADEVSNAAVKNNLKPLADVVKDFTLPTPPDNF